MKTKSTNSIIPSSRAAISALLGIGAASSTHAAIQVGNSVSVSGSQTIFWDIDGDTVTDFTVNASNFPNFAGISMGSGGLYDGRLAAIGSAMAVLSSNAVLDGNYQQINFVAAGLDSASWGSQGLSHISWNTPAVVGFIFSRSGQTHYAIGTLQYHLVGGSALSVTDVLWNTIPNQGITGAGTAVPEPATTAAGLAGLALGAAGLLRWRKGKAAPAA